MPCGPIGPGAPCGPAEPCAPTGPCGPVGPMAPALSGRPTPTPVHTAISTADVCAKPGPEGANRAGSETASEILLVRGMVGALTTTVKASESLGANRTADPVYVTRISAAFARVMTKSELLIVSE